jgi:hypothetical protein
LNNWMDPSSPAHARRGTWQPGNKLTAQSNIKTGFDENFCKTLHSPVRH